jgi:hypothetical protein
MDQAGNCIHLSSLTFGSLNYFEGLEFGLNKEELMIGMKSKARGIKSTESQ